MLIGFDLSHVFYPGSDAVMDLQTALAMVEFLVEANRIVLTRARELGYRIPRLRESGVRYREVDLWAPIPRLYQLQFGDCKNLTAADVAERRFYDRVDAVPNFRWVKNADGTTDYHILTQTGNTFKDTSLELGMNADEAARFYT